MTKLRVVKDGKTVWEGKPREYKGLEQFPAEHVGRPEKGTVELFVNDVLIGVQVSEAAEAKGKN